MQRRNLLALFLVGLFVVGSSLWSPKSVWLAASRRSEPQATEAKDAGDKVEAALAKEEPNTLIVGDAQGKIIDRYDTKELRKKYKSLADFLKSTHSNECKKISTKCRKCPDGRIYCTNDARFASGENRDENP